MTVGFRYSYGNQLADERNARQLVNRCVAHCSFSSRRGVATRTAGASGFTPVDFGVDVTVNLTTLRIRFVPQPWLPLASIVPTADSVALPPGSTSSRSLTMSDGIIEYAESHECMVIDGGARYPRILERG